TPGRTLLFLSARGLDRRKATSARRPPLANAATAQEGRVWRRREYMPERIPLTKEERRLLRAARREKQRQANIGRARKMHLARVESEKNGDAVPSTRSNSKTRHVY